VERAFADTSRGRVRDFIRIGALYPGGIVSTDDQIVSMSACQIWHGRRRGVSDINDLAIVSAGMSDMQSVAGGIGVRIVGRCISVPS
jgi:hypothetical protein